MTVTATTIQARNVATQIIYDFDRRRGLADWFVFGKRYIAQSIQWRPPARHPRNQLSLDQKGREGEYRDADDPGKKIATRRSCFDEGADKGTTFRI